MDSGKTLRVTNIQRMCFHDGPGIRTTVFLKGCCLCCPWCSNPENISFEKEKYNLDGREGIYGNDYTIDELYRIIVKDRLFWGNEGGLTFSGGEPLMQSDSLIQLLKLAKDEGINVVVESSLFSPINNTKKLIEFIDYFIVDIKILDPKVCRDVLHGNVDEYIRNIDFVYEKDKIKIFRIPLNYEYTFTENNKIKIKDFLRKYSGVEVQLFSVHSLGEAKYRSLNKDSWKGCVVEDRDVVSLCEELQKEGVSASIIHI